MPRRSHNRRKSLRQSRAFVRRAADGTIGDVTPAPFRADADPPQLGKDRVREQHVRRGRPCPLGERLKNLEDATREVVPDMVEIGPQSEIR